MKMVGAVLLVLAAIVGFVYAGKLEGFWLQPSLESLQPSAERLAKMKPSADDLARWQAQHPGEPLIPYGVKLKPGQTRPPLHGGDD